jgi:NADPH:quinone reductase-like Zn-dependent oxidoreductase
MRAALLTATGGPEALEVRADVPDPQPRAGEVLIRVSACGVNNTDLNTRRGWYGADGWDGGLHLPLIQGADICGRVVDVGARGDQSLVGRRVLVDPWIRRGTGRTWRDHTAYLGTDVDGGFAELCVVPRENAFPVESGWADVELATFACSWSAAENMLERAGLGPDERIAVTGASGGVGSALVQLAKVRGARVTAITSEAAVAHVTALGADLVLAREGGDVPDRAAHAAGPFDVVADVVGGPDMPGWMHALRRGGRYTCAGATAGPLVDLDLRVLYLRDLELIGATACPPELFPRLVGMIEDCLVQRPRIAGAYPLERIHEAQEAFEAKRTLGNVVVTLAEQGAANPSSGSGAAGTRDLL